MTTIIEDKEIKKETTTTTIVDDKSKLPLNALALDLLSVLEDFNALLQKETDALENAAFEDVERLQPSKRDLAKEYSTLVTLVASRKMEAKTLDQALQDRLIQARTTFTHSLHANMRALELMKRSTQRLANRILNIARDQIKDKCQTNYSAAGQMQAYKTSTLSINLDQEL